MERDRSDQLAVAANKNLVLDYGFMLADAVIVAGDRAGAHIDLTSNFSVSQVAQVGSCGPFSNPRLLDLHEASDAGFRPDKSVISQMSKRAYPGVFSNAAVAYHRALVNHDFLVENGVFQVAEAVDHAAGADFGLSFQKNTGINDRIWREFDRFVDVNGGRIQNGYSFKHPSSSNLSPQIDLNQ